MVEGGLDCSERLIEQVPLVRDGDKMTGAFAGKDSVAGRCCAVGNGVRAVVKSAEEEAGRLDRRLTRISCSGIGDFFYRQ